MQTDDWSGHGSRDRRRVPRSLLVFRSDATFPPLPESPAEARTWCQNTFSEWAVTADISPAVLVCEELVAFFIRHGRGDIHVALSSGPQRIAIAVTRGEEPPGAPLPVPGDALLDRVNAVASDWGVREAIDGGTTIWAEVAIRDE